ncbi:hypothetical protein [Microseira wollei]|nr:hypothetical protein [Microseira wollei]
MNKFCRYGQSFLNVPYNVLCCTQLKTVVSDRIPPKLLFQAIPQ